MQNTHKQKLSKKARNQKPSKKKQRRIHWEWKVVSFVPEEEADSQMMLLNPWEMESELNETACSKSLHLPRSILVFFPVFFGFRPWEPRRRLERSVRVNHGRRTQNSWMILIGLWHLSSDALAHSVKLYFCTNRVPVLMLLFWACRPFGLFHGSEPMTQINILKVLFFSFF